VTARMGRGSTVSGEGKGETRERDKTTTTSGGKGGPSARRRAHRGRGAGGGEAGAGSSNGSPFWTEMQRREENSSLAGAAIEDQLGSPELDLTPERCRCTHGVKRSPDTPGQRRFLRRCTLSASVRNTQSWNGGMMTHHDGIPGGGRAGGIGDFPP